MEQLWQQIVSDYLVPGAVAIVLYLAGKLVTAACAWVRTLVEKHDLGVIESAIQAAIVWVEVNCTDLSGPDKLAQVEDLLEEWGIEVDEARVELSFQQLKKYGDLPQAKTADTEPKEAA